MTETARRHNASKEGKALGDVLSRSRFWARQPNRVRRYLSFGASAIEANLHDLELPYRLFFHITNRCNARCTMCGIWKKPSNDELTTQEVLQVLRNAAGHIKWMDITGGEIFLREDILEILRFVAGEMPRMTMFHFATNGLLTERIVQGASIIATSNIPRFIITVSLDGPPDVHDRMRGVRGSFDRSLETFQALRQTGVAVVLGMTLTESNLDRFDATLEAVTRRIGGVTPRDFHVNLPQISQQYYGNQGLVSPPGPAFLETLNRIHRKRGVGLGVVDYLERTYLREAQTFVQTGRSPILCEALSSSAVLGPKGDVYPCIIFDRRIGNLRNTGYSLARLWRTSTRKRVRAAIRRGQCPQCWTPCEAYQAIIANTLPLARRRWQQGS